MRSKLYTEYEGFSQKNKIFVWKFSLFVKKNSKKKVKVSSI